MHLPFLKLPRSVTTTRSLARRWRAVLVLAGLWLLLATPASGAPALRLDVIPFTEPLARLVAIHPDGRLQLVDYFSGGLRVARVAQRQLTKAEQRDIDNQLAHLQLQGAVRETAPGLEQGDQFQLALVVDGAVHQYTSGFVDDATPPLRRLIDDLMRLAADHQRLATVPMAVGYARSRLVAASQAEAMQRTGSMRVFALAALPGWLQPTVAAVVRDPLLFHPLSCDAQAQLLSRSSPAGGVFIRARDGTLHQLHIFSTR
ncbi:MAG TPA: hypothetical protein VNT33_09500 [Telluria sp.]|nr:hypothetical protein [Telluria sp.]